MLWEGKSSMSDQSRKINEETHGTPGKRLEKKTKPALTPAQAQKRKEKRIMIVMIAAAVVMALAAAAVLAYNHWFKEPELPPVGPAQSGAPDSSAPPGEKTERIRSYSVERLESLNSSPCFAFSSYFWMALSLMVALSSSLRGS